MGRVSACLFITNKPTQIGGELLNCCGNRNAKDPKNATYSPIVEDEAAESSPNPSLLIPPGKFFVKTASKNPKGGRNFVRQNKTLVQANGTHKKGSYCQLYADFVFLKACRRQICYSFHGGILFRLR